LASQHHSKTNTAFFLAECKLKLVNAASVCSARRTTAVGGNLIPPTINYNSNYNISEGDSEMQYNSVNAEMIPQKS